MHCFSALNLLYSSSLCEPHRGDGFQTTGNNPGSRDDPNPFFKAIFSKPYFNKVVISPHVYGPSVTFANNGFSGPELWNRMSSSFGTLTTTGYTFNGVTRIFPVVIGETGSKFENAGDVKVRLSVLRNFKFEKQPVHSRAGRKSV